MRRGGRGRDGRLPASTEAQAEYTWALWLGYWWRWSASRLGSWVRGQAVGCGGCRTAAAPGGMHTGLAALAREEAVHAAAQERRGAEATSRGGTPTGRRTHLHWNRGGRTGGEHSLTMPCVPIARDDDPRPRSFFQMVAE